MLVDGKVGVGEGESYFRSHAGELLQLKSPCCCAPYVEPVRSLLNVGHTEVRTCEMSFTGKFELLCNWRPNTFNNITFCKHYYFTLQLILNSHSRRTCNGHCTSLCTLQVSRAYLLLCGLFFFALWRYGDYNTSNYNKIIIIIIIYDLPLWKKWAYKQEFRSERYVKVGLIWTFAKTIFRLLLTAVEEGWVLRVSNVFFCKYLYDGREK